MKIPLYVYYEILIRVSEAQSNLGEYLSVNEGEDRCMIRTTTGRLEVSKSILFRQFNDPDSILGQEIRELSERFEMSGRMYIPK